MIPAPPISLVQQIEIAHAKNEQKIQAEVGIPQTDISTEAALQIKHFGAWCRSRGVKSLPSVPATVAAFIRSEAAIGVPPDRIVDAVWAIEALHDNAGYSNPWATASVRTEVGRILNLDGCPRSWPKADRLKYNSLPIEIRAVIDRREQQNSRALRKIQNNFADFKKGTSTNG
jgi:hypothetical protein